MGHPFTRGLWSANGAKVAMTREGLALSQSLPQSRYQALKSFEGDAVLGTSFALLPRSVL
jgi:hypothetical protein